MKPIKEIRESGRNDDRSVGAFARSAERFLEAQRWCQAIVRGYVDRAWEGILGVFFFEIIPRTPDADSTVWVITGDLPPAYVCNDSRTGAEALEAYVYEMQRWVDAARAGRSVEDLIPVNVPPKLEFADMLASRLDFIRTKILPHYDHYDEQ